MQYTERFDMDAECIKSENGCKTYIFSPDRLSKITGMSYIKDGRAEFIVSASTEYRNLSPTEIMRQFVTMYSDNADNIQHASFVVRCSGNMMNPGIPEFVSKLRDIFYGIRNIEFSM